MFAVRIQLRNQLALRVLGHPALLLRGEQNPLPDHGDAPARLVGLRLGAGEDGRALMCAERQEIVMPAAVIERLEARALADHAGKSCNEQAAVVGRLPDHARAALKGCATPVVIAVRVIARPGDRRPCDRLRLC